MTKHSRSFQALVASLVVSVLAACGASPSQVAPVTPQEMPEQVIDAQARAAFRFGLGADISRDPGVALDEPLRLQAFEIQASLPERVDLRPMCSPVANQGQFGACTAFATVKGLQEALLKKQGRYRPQSPALLWYESKRQTGSKGKDDGVPTEFAVKMLDAYGSAPEEAFPYLPLEQHRDPVARQAFLQSEPSAQVVALSKQNRLVKGYELTTRLSGIRKALASGMPVVLAMRVFDNISKTPASGLMPMPTASSKFVGGHAVLAVGYDSAKQVLVVRNSWGSSWADGGYFYMPYSYFKTGGVRLAVIPKL
ncbi:MAG: C1 family peptidase [bacterium]|nr:C1 family peptidase [bacterium]